MHLQWPTACAQTVKITCEGNHAYVGEELKLFFFSFLNHPLSNNSRCTDVQTFSSLYSLYILLDENKVPVLCFI